MTATTLGNRRETTGLSGAVAAEWVKLWSVRST